MTRMTLKQKLVLMGITEHEAEVYGALLQADALKVLELTSMVKLPRPNIYTALHKLRKRGMVTAGKGRVSVYSAVPPDVAFKEILEADEKLRSNKTEVMKELRRLYTRRKPGNSRPNAIEVLGSDAAAYAYFREQTSRTRREIVTVYGTSMRMFSVAQADEEAVDRMEFSVLRRGVRVRCLYHPEVFEHGLDPARVEQVVSAGEEGRSSELLPVNMMLLDDFAAVLHLPEGDGKSTVYRINDQNLRQILRLAFEQVWAGATDVLDFLKGKRPSSSSV